MKFVTKKPHYNYLKNKWTVRHKSLQEKLWTKHKESLGWLKDHSKKFAVGSVATALLLASPVKQSLNLQQAGAFQTADQIGRETFLASDLSNLIPKEVRELTPSEEEKLTAVLSRDFGITVKPGINGIRLNRSYGLIGQEQHLARFPGDFVENHELPSYGMAPGLGAWRYFANSQSEMTQGDNLREKYYIAVPTFLSPKASSCCRTDIVIINRFLLLCQALH